MSTTRTELQTLVEKLSDEDVADVLDYIRWLLSENDVLTAEELAEAEHGRDEIERGDYYTLDELRSLLGR